jgi:hypothetical protein
MPQALFGPCLGEGSWFGCPYADWGGWVLLRSGITVGHLRQIKVASAPAARRLRARDKSIKLQMLFPQVLPLQRLRDKVDKLVETQSGYFVGILAQR